MVYKLSPSSSGVWQESVLYAFTGGNDGLAPGLGNLVFDRAGNLYGSNVFGANVSSQTCGNTSGCGVIFLLAPVASGGWKFNLLHTFSDGLVFDAKGSLYGGTQFADNLVGCNQFQIGACGQIFKLTPHSGVWKIAAEYPTPGFIAPVGDLLVDASGTVFGAACDKTYFTGGAVFEIVP